MYHKIEQKYHITDTKEMKYLPREEQSGTNISELEQTRTNISPSVHQTGTNTVCNSRGNKGNMREYI